jgi:hypothetical protein
MKFDTLVKMYLEEFNAEQETTQYIKPRKGYSTKGPTRLSRGKPDGFKGDTGMPEKTLIPARLFPQTKR